MNQPLLECVELANGKEPKACVIWMHGLGADGHDFVPLVHQMNVKACGPMRFVFPHAPVRPVTINNGYEMRAWYDILGTELVRREDEAGIRQSASQIEALIARELAEGIPSERIVLAGFSQGCAMSLFTGLRQAKPLAGIIALSGYLPVAAKTATERAEANLRTPIFMAHGSHDPVVPQARAEASRKVLEELGHRVEWKSYPMEHSVHPDEIDDIAAFLCRVLGQ